MVEVRVIEDSELEEIVMFYGLLMWCCLMILHGG